MGSKYDAIVIGGGVNGCSIAFSLAKKGYKVIILEQDRLASKASQAAAGMLGAQAELIEDGPLFQFAKNSRAMFPTVVRELEELSDTAIGFVDKGLIKVAVTEEQLAELKQAYAFQTKIGEEISWLSNAEVKEMEPEIASELLGAVYIPKDGQVRAQDLSIAFAKAASSLGVEIQEYTRVYDFIHKNGKITGVRTHIGEFYGDRVVVTAGAWSTNLLKESGLNLPAYPVKGECFSVTLHQPIITRTIFSHGCYIVPKKGGRIIVGATVKPHTFDQKVSLDGISTLMEKAKRLLPNIVKGEWEKAWAGIRPQTEDGLPFLGEHPSIKGLYVATGHYRNGILLSPATGEFMANLIDGQKVDPALAYAFRVDRFQPVTT